MTGDDQKSSLVVGAKRGVPIYTTNPSIPPKAEISRSRRARIGDDRKGLIINEGSGEILGRGGAFLYEWEEVDKERFVKLFLDGLKQASGLSKSGLALFGFVYLQLREKQNIDTVNLSYIAAKDKIDGLQDRSYQRGLRELLEKEFLFRSPYDGTFFVNIRYMFNGDRLAFVKAYHLKRSQKQPKLPLDPSSEREGGLSPMSAARMPGLPRNGLQSLCGSREFAVLWPRCSTEGGASAGPDDAHAASCPRRKEG